MLALVCASPAAFAQQADDPVDTARIQLGPLGVTPTLSLNNLGVDSNVFNTTVNPQRDYTATLTPSADAWFRAGRSLTAIQGRL
ncbi:MAG: hypothetical protein AB7K63_18850, partial [Vicinamibacterales bacterium]